MIDFKKPKELKLNPNPKLPKVKKPKYWRKRMREVGREMPY
jgi:hypothetical protein